MKYDFYITPTPIIHEEHSRKEAVKKASELKKIEDLELNPERSTTEIEESNHKEKYRIIIDLLSTKR